MFNINPYHEGELAVQKQAGESFDARVNGSMISNTIPFGGSSFIALQRLMIIGTVDTKGDIWTSLLIGQPGVVQALNKSQLEIDISKSVYMSDECFLTDPGADNKIGILMIELESRLRLRINGRITQISDEQYTIDIDQAYANCPKYIQRRQWKTPHMTHPAVAKPCAQGTELNHAQKNMIASSDTFFVASASPEHGIDASHRGGKPGFVQLLNNGKLIIPDFKGNSMFNTLGNFAVYPRAGLLFISFDSGKLLQLTGKTEILWDKHDPQQISGGTKRFWQFETCEWREHQLPSGFDWELIDYSPYIPEPIVGLSTDFTLSLRVERIQHEAEQIKSFRLQAGNAEQLPEFKPGAHIQVQVQLPDHSIGFRHYSLLSSPDDISHYEIAVLSQPEGLGGSRYMHQKIHEGDIIEIRQPQNDFPMTAKAEHSILIAGGIGITPILAMLQKLVSDQQSFELHYSARRRTRLAFHDRIKRIANDQSHFYTSDEHQEQRLDLHTLLSTPKPGVHIYVCGPRSMIGAVRDIAATRGWSAGQIHYESFGARPRPDDRPIRIELVRSGQMISVASDQSILDTLLNAGIHVPYQCKRGECGMCTTRVLAGEPDHRDLCLNSEEKSRSMCLCVSRAQGKILKLDV